MQAQKNDVNIWRLMERRDLNIKEVDALAKAYFDKNGTGRGTGYKQFQRWRYEQAFHLDKNGNFIAPEVEFRAYQEAFPVGKAQARNLVGAWTEIGPFGKNPTSGWNPGQARVSGIAIHPTTPATIYLSSPGGGIWKSTNSGATWTPKIDNANSAWMDVYHICIAPNDQTVLFAGLQEGGVIKSTNSGDTWAVTGTGPVAVRKVLVHPDDKLKVLVAASNGIWRSTNGGTTWDNRSTDDAQDIEFKADDSEIVIATGSDNNTRRSTDNGVTWTPIALPAGTGGRTMVAVSASTNATDANTIYVVQANGEAFGGFYKSTDGGLTYTKLITGNTTNLNYFGYEQNGSGSGGQASYDMAIAVHPTNINEIHIAGIICWKSTDGGMTFSATTVWNWNDITDNNYNHADVHQLEFVGTTLYAGSDGGLYKSTDNGVKWTDLSQGYNARQFYRISTSKTTANVIAGGLQDQGSVFRQSGTTWVEWLGGDGMDCAINPTDATMAIGTTQNGGIYKTTNSGQTRTNLTRPAAGNWVTPIAWHPTHTDTVYGGWNGFYRSHNQGANWTLLGATEAIMNCIAIAPSNTQYLYAVNADKFFRSINGGATWTNPPAPGGTPANVTSITVSPLDPLKIWATTSATGNNVFVSTDGGDMWTNISAGLPAIAARSIAVDNNAAEDLYVGMNIGVYTRNNVNTTWTVQATGLPLVAVREVEIQKVSGKLFVATYGRGIWESGLSNTVLPVELVSFTGKTVGNSNELTWKVAEQIGIKQYNLEHSEDGIQAWQKIETIAPNKNRQATYTAFDKTPTPVSYYRLQVEEQDGTKYYSKVVSVDRQKFKLGITQLFPNPVEKVLNLDFDAAQSGNVTVVIRDLLGRILISRQIDSPEGNNKLSIDVSSLPNATYYLFMTDGKNQAMEKFVKQ
jgi:hypothetical protein